MRGVRAPLYTQELLQSWELSSGTTVSCSVSELWAAGGRQELKGHRARPRKTGQQEGRWVEASASQSPKEESPGLELGTPARRQGSVRLGGRE